MNENTTEIPRALSKPGEALQRRRGSPQIGRVAFVDMIMGMPISIHVKAADTARPEIAAAADNAFATLRKVDALFSRWRSDSELSRLQAGDIAAGDCHPWQAEVLELALQGEEATDGLFSAWHASDGSGRAAYDPTGLVKGWAVERAAELLRVVPRISFCLSAGGDMVVGVGAGMTGIAPNWLIGIESPYTPGTYAATVEVATGAVATSGSAARGAHVIDPRSSEPITRAGSATVVGPHLTWADIWATAAYVDPLAAHRLMTRRAAAYRLTML
ncbi:MAG: FAD:protein FMN transferase [Tetrasphaera sp.]